MEKEYERTGEFLTDDEVEVLGELYNNAQRAKLAGLTIGLPALTQVWSITHWHEFYAKIDEIASSRGLDKGHHYGIGTNGELLRLNNEEA